MRACVCKIESEETTTKSIKTSESQSHCYTNKPVIHTYRFGCKQWTHSPPLHFYSLFILSSFSLTHTLAILYSTNTASSYCLWLLLLFSVYYCRCCFFALCPVNLYEVYRTRALLFGCSGVCYIYDAVKSTHEYVYDFKNPDEMCEKEIAYSGRVRQTEMPNGLRVCVCVFFLFKNGN